MKIVKVRKISRGERVIAIPKELFRQLETLYMSVEMDANGRLTYVPIDEARK